MSIPGLRDWLATPQGRYVLGWEQARLDAAVYDIFGFNALQVGLPEVDCLRQNRMPLRQKVAPDPHVGADVVSDLRQLPFAGGSVDLVVLPHVLEFCSDPHQILREVERILIPEGQVVIVGFNPISLWGLRRRLPHRPDGFPWEGQYLSVLRLRDWLALLGFEVNRGNFGCYAPPCQQEQWFRRFQFMEPAGDRWWGFAGGVYILQAIKRVHGMRLVKPAWRRAPGLAKGLAPIAQRETPHAQ